MNTTSDHQENTVYIFAPEEVVRIPTTAEMVMPDPRPEGPFDWIEWNGVKARSTGNARGYNERGYETFCVKIKEKIYFGSIDRSFLVNGNDFNIKINSFGFYEKDGVGGPDSIRSIFSKEDSVEIKNILIKMVEMFFIFRKKPIVSIEYEKAHFMGGLYLAKLGF